MKKAVAIVCVFLMSLTLVFANVDNYGVPPYAFDPANGHTAAYIVVQDPANSNEELTLHDFIYNLPLNHTHGFWRRSAGNTLNILYDEGNVGVGGESPTARLTIHHGYGNFLRLNHSPGGLLYTISATGSGFTHSSSSPIQFQSEEDQILRLERQGNGESLGFSRGSEIMRLTSSHRLGFGSGAHNDRMVLTSSGNLELANSLTVGNN
ncbi:MAG: hypothetical protein ACMXYF_04130, partial [Candidatus Woesearchaeota archaeon]